MKALQNINPLARAIGVIGTVAALVTAVTFAALTSSATLSANSLSTATAGLFVASGDVNASNNQATGFAFNELVPGEPSDPEQFNLKNSGDVPLDLTVQIPSVPSTGIVDADKLRFCFSQIDDLEQPAEEVDTACYALSNLVAGPQTLPGGPLPANGDNILYQVTAEVQDGFTEDGATIPNFDFVITGTQATSTTDQDE